MVSVGRRGETTGRAPGTRVLFMAAWVAAMLLPACLFAAAIGNDACLSCHGQKGVGAPFVDMAAHRRSIHGAHLCVSCHSDIAELPHPGKLSPVSCGACHRVETQIYTNSDHGRAVRRGRHEAATCKDCHGHSHTLLNSRDPDSPVNRKNIVTTCARCHADAQRMSGVRLAERDPLGSYNHTVHGQAFAEGKSNAAVCSDCHGTHDLHGSFNPRSRLFKNNIPDTCGRCHQNVAAVYGESIHGQAVRAGLKEAPVCTDCHGEHTIRSPKDRSSTVWSGAVTKTCAGCHASERIILKFGLPADRLQSYLDSYHGLAAQRGDLHVAHCASCHGFHDVLASSDPRSSIHKRNLSMTCGRCHPGAGPRLSTGYVHGPPTGKHRIVSFARMFYLIVIPLTLGFMLLHNLLDWWRKSWGGVAVHLEVGSGPRLTANERWQHAFLTVSFLLLAYTGFALKFHDAAVVRLLAPFGEEMRRAVHRWAALAFGLLGVYHLAYLTLTPRGRALLREFLPRKRDIVTFLLKTAHNVGLRAAPPAEDAFYNYAEKIEYWSLVWGSLVMIVTGGILVFNNYALKHFPLWVADLATLVHYYEAVLACLAILVWHLYGVIFDPAVYPMNWAWLTGRIRRKDKEGA